MTMLLLLIVFIAIFFAAYFCWMYIKEYTFHQNILELHITTLDKICGELAVNMDETRRLITSIQKEYRTTDSRKKRNALAKRHELELQKYCDLDNAYKSVSAEAWRRINTGQATIQGLNSI